MARTVDSARTNTPDKKVFSALFRFSAMTVHSPFRQIAWGYRETGNKKHIANRKCRLLERFFFDHVGAKKKALQKESAVWEFRRLRTATRTPRPRPRRLLKKAGENFYPTKADCFFLRSTNANMRSAFNQSNEQTSRGSRRAGVPHQWKYTRRRGKVCARRPWSFLHRSRRR